MKKFLTVALVLLLCLALLSACGTGKKELPVAESGEAEEELHYRDLMVPYEEIEKGDRIVFLQTTLCYTGREGLYTEADLAPAEDFAFNGETVPAFLMANATRYLFNELSGQVKVYDGAGTETELSAEEFNALKVLSLGVLADSADGELSYLDSFTGGKQVDLASEDGSVVITDFRYAVAETGEGVLSVSSNQTIPMSDILAEMGWDADIACNMVASDGFYVPDTILDGQRGSIVGLLSGTTINGMITDTSIAQGLINDLIYIEKAADAQ